MEKVLIDCKNEVDNEVEEGMIIDDEDDKKVVISCDDSGIHKEKQVDCKNEVEYELEEGEILNDKDDVKVMVLCEQKKETRVIHKNNHVGDITEKKLIDYHHELMCYKKLCLSQQNDQNMHKKTCYKEISTSQQTWNAPPKQHFMGNQNRPSNNGWLIRRNLKRNANYEYLTNDDMPIQKLYKRDQETVNNNAVFRNDQHYSREQYYTSATYVNKNKNYQNYFKYNSRNVTGNNSVTKIVTKKIPSLLDMIIPIPPEFQKTNSVMNNINNNNSAQMSLTSSNNLVIDETFDTNENFQFHSTQNADLMTEIDKECKIIERGEEKERELATPINYHFTLDSWNDEFDDLVKNGEVVLAQKIPNPVPLINTTRPAVTFPQANQQIRSQQMFPDPHGTNRNPRNRVQAVLEQRIPNPVPLINTTRPVVTLPQTNQQICSQQMFPDPHGVHRNPRNRVLVQAVLEQRIPNPVLLINTTRPAVTFPQTNQQICSQQMFPDPRIRDPRNRINKSHNFVHQNIN